MASSPFTCSSAGAGASLATQELRVRRNSSMRRTASASLAAHGRRARRNSSMRQDGPYSKCGVATSTLAAKAPTSASAATVAARVHWWTDVVCRVLSCPARAWLSSMHGCHPCRRSRATSPSRGAASTERQSFVATETAPCGAPSPARRAGRCRRPRRRRPSRGRARHRCDRLRELAARAHDPQTIRSRRRTSITWARCGRGRT